MKQFSALFDALDSTASTRQKIDALCAYFEDAAPEDAAWAVHFLSGQKLRRIVGPALLRRWLVEASDLPAWLIDESYAAVGDLAETIALLQSPAGGGACNPTNCDVPLHSWVERLTALSSRPVDEQREQVIGWWSSLRPRESFLVNKLMTGGLRIGVSRALLARALAEHTGIARERLLQRLAGEWVPSGRAYAALIDPAETALDGSRPYPFYLASPLDVDPRELGAVEDFVVEWKWDGMRAQLIKRHDSIHLWSRGEERITDRFPDIISVASSLSDGTVLDGEILAWTDDAPAPFADLQRRIGRKRVSQRLVQEVPVRFLAYDLLEHAGTDLRELPLDRRRSLLVASLQTTAPCIAASPEVVASSWAQLDELRAESRQRSVEGLMLKQRDSRYGVGRQRGAWWKWKIDPYTVDAVLLYAYPGHGRRSNLYTDYTFAVWNAGELVPVAKAYSGLELTEIERLDRWIRRHTIERFGPVRSVAPELVFELAFEGIARSTRHKSGVALRFPRILRWRHEKTAEAADTLESLVRLIDKRTM
ncbi:MAG TPA: ATP-dependent DNA ligase [Steroidobacteraceae bacterium]|nr:ATP-dependent DNA ligase [Steroidobacteraceae bacterium]